MKTALITRQDGYGPGDNYDPETSHVLPALIRKAHAAKLAGAHALEIWGSGTPRREFLHVDDLADACVYLMRGYSQEAQVNIGSGKDIAIRDLARLVAEVVGFDGAIVRDTSKPDGTPRKLLDSSRLRATGWRPRIGLRDGIARVYAEYQQQVQA
jgi:GDP-L-fucose synthase